MGNVGSLGNLPRRQTRLIGRATELVEINALLDASALVTVTACGGAGKTCISLAIATELNAQFADGIWFVDLARVSDPGLIPATVGALFDLEIPPGERGVRLLVRTLAAKSALLILDNCEHVIEAAAELAAALIGGCSYVRILATSREPLGIGGECVYKLPLLSVPPSNLRLDAARATSFDAVALFVARARAVRYVFRLTDDNAATIGAICRQLDGIALAIELAAARVSILSVNEIAQRLSKRFSLLTNGDRTTLPRQQTLRALIDWSYDLLSLEEQLVFRRLSVFVGGWTVEAMVKVLAEGDLDEDKLFDLLGGLVRKSLVVDRIGESISRYQLLQSVREYAGEKFLADADRDDCHRRHADCYLRLANGANATYYTTPSKQWLLALQSELENFRSALHWSLTLEKDVRLGAALAGALVSFLLQFSPHESLHWTRKALSLLPPDIEPVIEAALSLGVSRAAVELLPADQMRTAAERAVTLARIIGDPQPLCNALRLLIKVLGSYFPDEQPLAGELAQEAMALARALGDPIQIALVLRLGSLTIDNANVAQKQAVLKESSTLLLAHGNDLQIAISFMWLAEYDFCHGGALKALTFAREAMRFAEKSGSLSMLVQMATNFAQYAAGQGNWRETRRAAADAAQAAVKLGMDDQVTWAVQALAIASAGTGDFITSANLLGFCDSRIGTLHGQRQADFTEDILYRRLLATLQRRVARADLDAAILAGAKLTETEALRAGLGQAPVR